MREHKDEKVAPCSRTGHGAAVIEDDMWVFGGHADEEEIDKLNDVWRYNVPSNTWEEVKGIDEDSKPQARSGHALGVYNHYLIIHGGIFEITKELDDTYLFNTQTKKFIFSGETRQKSPNASPTRKGMYGGGNSPVRARSPHKTQTLRPKQMSPGRKVGLSPQKSKKIGKSPHKKKKKMAQKNQESKEDDALSSPTSVSMKNSFIIQNADPSFDQYYHQMKKRKHQQEVANEMGETFNSNRLKGRKPPARDGHSGLIYGDEYIVFGGDRHQMPFNDIYALDLNSLIRQRGA